MEKSSLQTVQVLLIPSRPEKQGVFPSCTTESGSTSWMTMGQTQQTQAPKSWPSRVNQEAVLQITFLSEWINTSEHGRQ